MSFFLPRAFRSNFTYSNFDFHGPTEFLDIIIGDAFQIFLFLYNAFYISFLFWGFLRFYICWRHFYKNATQFIRLLFLHQLFIFESQTSYGTQSYFFDMRPFSYYMIDATSYSIFFSTYMKFQNANGQIYHKNKQWKIQTNIWVHTRWRPPWVVKFVKSWNSCCRYLLRKSQLAKDSLPAMHSLESVFGLSPCLKSTKNSNHARWINVHGCLSKNLPYTLKAFLLSFPTFTDS